MEGRHSGGADISIYAIIYNSEMFKQSVCNPRPNYGVH